jgi:hypothetical protein
MSSEMFQMWQSIESAALVIFSLFLVVLMCWAVRSYGD